MACRKNFTPEQLQRMKQRYEAGESFRDIALDVPCAKNTVRAALLGAGVAPNISRSMSAKKIGNSLRRGAKWSPEARARLSAALRGKPGTRFGPHSEATLAKISAGTKGKNVKHTPERRLEIERLRQACKRFLSRSLLAAGRNKTVASAHALGYSPSDLAAHLGERPPDAHVDHYVPIAEFTRRRIYDVRVINALPNLRWLAGEANRKKSDKVPPDAEATIARCFIAADVSFGPRLRYEALTAHFSGSGVSYTRGIA